MAQVFISYSRKDISFVEQLASDLKSAGLDVWYDVSSLGGGSRWRMEIEKAIRNGQFVIVVLSPDSIASEWVEREFLFASNLKKKIIPLMYRHCDLPLNYLDLNYIDVQGKKYQQEFPDLLNALAIDSKNATPILAKVGKAPSRWKLAGMIVGAVAILSCALWFFLSRMDFPLPFDATPRVTEVPSFPTELDLPLNIADDAGVEMVLVRAGNFTMGSETDNALRECDKYRSDCQDKWFFDESPSRVIYVDSFYIDKYEVSNALYHACEDAGGCVPPVQVNSNSRTKYYRDSQFDDYPIVYVDWNMANAYCQWRGGYLPTEIQWEKAARGTNGNTYPWGNDFLEGVVNFCDKHCDSPAASKNFDDGYKDTAPVDEYPLGSSFYDVFNMAGNVWEWVSDWYQVYPGGDPIGSPYYEPAQTYRVIRGGGWDSSIDLIRTTNRDPRRPTDADASIGFRCARDATP